MNLSPGTVVNVSYTGYWVAAEVVEAPTDDGWVLIRQLTDYEDRPPEDRPTYLAGLEFIAMPGEPLRRGPFQ